MKPLSNFFEAALPLIAVAVCIWLFSDNLPFQKEIVVYPLFCPGGRHDAACPKLEETANRTTYKALVDQQTVIYWTEDGDEPKRFARCAVRDSENWVCRHEASPEVVPSHVYRMIHGSYTETTTSPWVNSTDIFYPVSKWHWWLIRFKNI